MIVYSVPLCGIFLFLLLSVASAQTWESGDNSTVKGCSTHCSVDDPSLACWNKTLAFFEKTLIGQLRHYISVQVDIDQWWRRHGKEDGQDFDQVRDNAVATMVGLLDKEHDVLDAATVRNVTASVIDRVKGYSNRVIAFVPHFACPLPCEYRHDTYRNLFIASVILNVCLLVSVLPFMRKMIRQHSSRDSLLGRSES